MRYAVDKIEDDIVVLESLTDKKIINVSAHAIKLKISEGDILLFDGKRYYLDDDEKQKRLNRIKSKMERLKNDL